MLVMTNQLLMSMKPTQQPNENKGAGMGAGMGADMGVLTPRNDFVQDALHGFVASFVEA